MRASVVLFTILFSLWNVNQAYRNNLCTDTGLVDGLIRVCISRRSLPDDDVVAKWYRNQVKQGFMSDNGEVIEKENELQEFKEGLRRALAPSTTRSKSETTTMKPSVDSELISLLTTEDLSELRHFIRMLRLLIDTASYGLNRLGASAADDFVPYNASNNVGLQNFDENEKLSADTNGKPYGGGANTELYRNEKPHRGNDHIVLLASDAKNHFSTSESGKSFTLDENEQSFRGKSIENPFNIDSKPFNPVAEPLVDRETLEPMASEMKKSFRPTADRSGKTNPREGNTNNDEELNRNRISHPRGRVAEWQHRGQFESDKFLNVHDAMELGAALQDKVQNQVLNRSQDQNQVYAGGISRSDPKQDDRKEAAEESQANGRSESSILEFKDQKEHRKPSSRLDELAASLSEKHSPSDSFERWRSGERTELLDLRHLPREVESDDGSLRDAINDLATATQRPSVDDLRLQDKSFSSYGKATSGGRLSDEIDIRVLKYLNYLIQDKIDNQKINSIHIQNNNTVRQDTKLPSAQQSNMSASGLDSNQNSFTKIDYEITHRIGHQLDKGKENEKNSPAVYSNDAPYSRSQGNDAFEEMTNKDKEKDTLLELLTKYRRRVPRSVSEDLYSQINSKNFRGGIEKPTAENYDTSSLKDLVVQIKLSQMKELLDSISAISSTNSTSLMDKFFQLFEANKKEKESGSQTGKNLFEHVDARAEGEKARIKSDSEIKSAIAGRPEAETKTSKTVGSKQRLESESDGKEKFDISLEKGVGQKSRVKPELEIRSDYKMRSEPTIRSESTLRSDPAISPEIKSDIELKSKHGIFPEVRPHSGMRSNEGTSPKGLSSELLLERRQMLERMTMAAQNLLVRCCIQGCSDSDLLDFCNGF